MHKYLMIDIKYIWNIKKNKLKLENLIKLSISIKYIKKAARNLKIGISGFKIKAKEEYFITVNAKNNIPIPQAFYLYI